MMAVDKPTSPRRALYGQRYAGRAVHFKAGPLGAYFDARKAENQGDASLAQRDLDRYYGLITAEDRALDSLFEPDQLAWLLDAFMGLPDPRQYDGRTWRLFTDDLAPAVLAIAAEDPERITRAADRLAILTAGQTLALLDRLERLRLRRAHEGVEQ